MCVCVCSAAYNLTTVSLICLEFSVFDGPRDPGLRLGGLVVRSRCSLFTRAVTRNLVGLLCESPLVIPLPYQQHADLSRANTTEFAFTDGGLELGKTLRLHPHVVWWHKTCTGTPYCIVQPITSHAKVSLCLHAPGYRHHITLMLLRNADTNATGRRE